MKHGNNENKNTLIHAKNGPGAKGLGQYDPPHSASRPRTLSGRLTFGPYESFSFFVHNKNVFRTSYFVADVEKCCIDVVRI